MKKTENGNIIPGTIINQPNVDYPDEPDYPDEDDHAKPVNPYTNNTQQPQPQYNQNPTNNNIQTNAKPLLPNQQGQYNQQGFHPNQQQMQFQQNNQQMQFQQNNQQMQFQPNQNPMYVQNPPQMVMQTNYVPVQPCQKMPVYYACQNQQQYLPNMVPVVNSNVGVYQNMNVQPIV